MQNLPKKIRVYITRRFSDGTVSDVRRVRSRKGNIFYLLEISEDEVLYRLRFDITGRLLRRVAEPRFDEDLYQGGFYGEPDQQVI